MTTTPPPGQYYPASQPGSGYGQAPPRHLRGFKPLVISLVFFVVGIVLIVLGVVVFAKTSLDKVDKFSRVDLSSSGTVTFSHTGNYVAYYEASNVSDSTRQVPQVPVQLTSPSGATRLLSTPYGGRTDGKIKILTYQNDGHNGIALYQFKISQKGAYQVRVGTNTLANSGADIAFGQSIASGTVAGGFTIIGGVLLIIAAIVLLIVGLVKRGRHKSQMRHGGGPVGGYGYPPPPPGPSFTKQGQPGQYGPGQYGPGPQGQYGPGQPPGQGGGYQGYPGYPGQGEGYPGR